VLKPGYNRWLTFELGVRRDKHFKGEAHNPQGCTPSLGRAPVRGLEPRAQR